MEYPRRYFNSSPEEASEIMELLLPQKNHGFTDDIVPDPGSPHGADVHRQQNENTATPAKRINPRGPVSSLLYAHEKRPIAYHPRESAEDPVKKSPVTATKKRRREDDPVRSGYVKKIRTLEEDPGLREIRTLERRTRKSPIKAAPSYGCPSVYPLGSTRAAANMHHIYRNYQSPTRRWLAGAPGGWWPSDVECASSDEEFAENSPHQVHHHHESQSSPLRQGSAEPEVATPILPHDSSRPASDGQESQSSPLRQGSAEPEVATPILPHDSSRPASDDDDDIQILEQSFEALSTLALASDDEDTARYMPTVATSSSSSAYGSATEEGGDNEQPEKISSAHAQRKAKGDPSPTKTRKRRTREERAARNAAWARSVSAQPAVIEVMDLTIETDDLCVPVNQYPAEAMDWAEYRALCLVFERTAQPRDGQALVRCINAEIRRGLGRIRAQNWRDARKRRLALQARQEAEEAGQLMDEITGEPAPAPGPARGKGAKRKKTSTSARAKKQATKARVQPDNEVVLQHAEHHAEIESPRPVAASTPTAAIAEPAASIVSAPATITSGDYAAMTSASIVSAPATITSGDYAAMTAASIVSAPATITSGSYAAMTTANILGAPATIGSGNKGGAASPVQGATSSLDIPGPHAAPAPATTQTIMWLASPAAFIARQTMDLDIASLFQHLPPMASPAAAIQQAGPSMSAADMPPLSLEELNDEVNLSLDVPPTPATPAHLQGEPSNCGDLRVELLSPAANAAIRMRITRCNGTSSTTTSSANNDDPEEQPTDLSATT
ncbi:hypothetical protein QAD02_015846 [Eretmocerus hayati]|uniref:Uncharacterized protein n=1 Tax=Eretmocerus hayati TaxID=131215 RepID=A0ACC2PBU0_9HYME|nr:hypothetical protein QAD02_015846 [Eretmocerus hayati]